MVVWTGSLIALLVVGILAVVGAAIGVAVALGDRVKSTDTGPGPRLTADPSTVQGIWPAWNGDVVLYPKPPADTTLGGTLTLTPTNITPDTAALWAGATTSLEAARRDGVPLLVASFFLVAVGGGEMLHWNSLEHTALCAAAHTSDGTGVTLTLGSFGHADWMAAGVPAPDEQMDAQLQAFAIVWLLTAAQVGAQEDTSAAALATKLRSDSAVSTSMLPWVSEQMGARWFGLDMDLNKVNVTHSSGPPKHLDWPSSISLALDSLLRFPGSVPSLPLGGADATTTHMRLEFVQQNGSKAILIGEFVEPFIENEMDALRVYGNVYKRAWKGLVYRRAGWQLQLVFETWTADTTDTTYTPELLMRTRAPMDSLLSEEPWHLEARLKRQLVEWYVRQHWRWGYAIFGQHMFWGPITASIVPPAGQTAKLSGPVAVADIFNRFGYGLRLGVPWNLFQSGLLVGELYTSGRARASDNNTFLPFAQMKPASVARTHGDRNHRRYWFGQNNGYTIEAVPGLSPVLKGFDISDSQSAEQVDKATKFHRYFRLCIRCRQGIASYADPPISLITQWVDLHEILA